MYYVHEETGSCVTQAFSKYIWSLLSNFFKHARSNIWPHLETPKSCGSLCSISFATMVFLGLHMAQGIVPMHPIQIWPNFPISFQFLLHFLNSSPITIALYYWWSMIWVVLWGFWRCPTMGHSINKLYVWSACVLGSGFGICKGFLCMIQCNIWTCSILIKSLCHTFFW